jgi:polyisoprenoid-binding protein YceI
MFRNIIILSSLIFSFASAETYKLDPSHTSVGFRVSHLVVSKVSGRFDKFDGGFDFANGKVSNINVKVDLDSINTNEPKRDKHLRSKDFFGVRDDKGGLVKANQWMTFTAGGDEVNVGDNNITGKLTIGKITKDVTLKVHYGGETTDPWKNKRVAFSATGKINRQDFGVKWNKSLDGGGFVVGDDVEIIIDSEAIAQAPKNEKSEK